MPSPQPDWEFSKMSTVTISQPTFSRLTALQQALEKSAAREQNPDLKAFSQEIGESLSKAEVVDRALTPPAQRPSLPL
jgi:4-alpha-glucanotransferase